MQVIEQTGQLKLNQTPSETYSDAVRPLFSDAPQPGESIELAAGLWLLRLPLASVLDHINVYVLEDKDGWTLVDTGNNTPVCRKALAAAFDRGIFAQKPITRVIATHYHPDHLGLAGMICDRGAVFQTTQACWLHARWLQLEQRNLPYPEEISFVERVGMKGMELAAFCRREPSDYSNLVLPIPYAYQRIRQGDRLKIGARCWTIHLGYGHAAEHATLWSDDGFAISGDQILPRISANLSVHPSEPDADLVAEWVESCWRFAKLATKETVCLPGHNLPFTGVSTRCRQMISSQEAVLNRLLSHLTRPSTAIDCLETVYRRQLQPHERNVLIAETLGYLNHLYHRGIIKRDVGADRAYLWYRANPRDRDLQICFNEPKSNNLTFMVEDNDDK